MSVTVCGGGGAGWWVQIFYPYTSTVLLVRVSQKTNTIYLCFHSVKWFEVEEEKKDEINQEPIAISILFDWFYAV